MKHIVFLFMLLLLSSAVLAANNVVKYEAIDCDLQNEARAQQASLDGGICWSELLGAALLIYLFIKVREK